MAAASRIAAMTDEQLRSEASRRRLTASALSILGSVLLFAAAYLIGQSQVPTALYVGLVILVIANLLAVPVYFRWMSAPAKEIARRRKRTVLRMLGTEPTSEA